MESLQIVLSALGSRLNELELALADAPKELVLSACFLPMILAIISRRVFVFVGSVLLASMALLVVAQPSSVAVTIAIGAYVGSVIIALSGIHARRRDVVLHAELKNLRDEVHQLQNSDAQRFLGELKSSDKTAEAE